MYSFLPRICTVQYFLIFLTGSWSPLVSTARILPFSRSLSCSPTLTLSLSLSFLDRQREWWRLTIKHNSPSHLPPICVLWFNWMYPNMFKWILYLFASFLFFFFWFCFCFVFMFSKPVKWPSTDILVSMKVKIVRVYYFFRFLFFLYINVCKSGVRVGCEDDGLNLFRRDDTMKVRTLRSILSFVKLSSRFKSL